MKDRVIYALKWFLTKHGIVVDLFILCAIFATVQYYTYDPVALVFQILALIAVSPVAVYILLQLFIGIPVSIARDVYGRSGWFIDKVTAVQMWFNRPWTPYR